MWILLLLVVSFVKSEGYYCPYEDLGATENENMLYDYYDGDFFIGYWTRTGETGWISRNDYCFDKGDLTKHSDAGEFKCNDSRGNCFWTGSMCAVSQDREADCRALCEAVLNNQGPECLGNCPNGKQSNDLYNLCTQEPVMEPMEPVMEPMEPVMEPMERVIRMNNKCYKMVL